MYGINGLIERGIVVRFNNEEDWNWFVDRCVEQGVRQAAADNWKNGRYYNFHENSCINISGKIMVYSNLGFYVNNNYLITTVDKVEGYKKMTENKETIKGEEEMNLFERFEDVEDVDINRKKRTVTVELTNGIIITSHTDEGDIFDAKLGFANAYVVGKSGMSKTQFKKEFRVAERELNVKKQKKIKANILASRKKKAIHEIRAIEKQEKELKK